MMKEKKLFLLLFFLSLLLFILDKKGFLDPLKEKVEQRVNPLREGFYRLMKRPGDFFESLRLKKETGEKIKEKERELDVYEQKIESLKKENEDLRRLLQAPLPKDWSFLPAKVLGKKRYLIIDKGGGDGVRKEMVAVFENFLVGKIVEVNPSTSLVLLPFDSESKIAVQTESGARGLVEGRFGTKIFLTRVLQKETLEVGDLVVTTGEGYLPELLIGKIKNKSTETQEPFQEVEVEPGFDYGELTTVFLVRT